MIENSKTPAGEASTTQHLSSDDPSSTRLHDLFPFEIGGHVFAVFAEQVDATAEAKPYAPLPRAPKAVVGIACVRGRMLTVIDPTTAFAAETPSRSETLPCVIALAGDDQLGLLAESYRDKITISAADIEQTTASEPAHNLTLGLVRYGGEEILLLDADRLFDLAVRRKERRRRRF